MLVGLLILVCSIENNPMFLFGYSDVMLMIGKVLLVDVFMLKLTWLLG